MLHVRRAAVAEELLDAVSEQGVEARVLNADADVFETEPAIPTADVVAKDMRREKRLAVTSGAGTRIGISFVGYEFQQVIEFALSPQDPAFAESMIMATCAIAVGACAIGRGADTRRKKLVNDKTRPLNQSEVGNLIVDLRAEADDAIEVLGYCYEKMTGRKLRSKDLDRFLGNARSDLLGLDALVSGGGSDLVRALPQYRDANAFATPQEALAVGRTAGTRADNGRTSTIVPGSKAGWTLS